MFVTGLGDLGLCHYLCHGNISEGDDYYGWKQNATSFS